VEIIITDNAKDKVILLPKTIDFYQIEITRMLETERYGEAIDLLRFLGGCNSGDARLDAEWAALLAWLESMRPEGTASYDVTEEDEESEADLFRQHLRHKLESEPDYVEQLIKMLDTGHDTTKQILALEQLAYLEDPKDGGFNITDWLTQWLMSSAQINPWAQFKALQTLKMRGVKDNVRIIKEGVELNIKINEVPLELKQYPEQFITVLHKLQKVAEINEPSLPYLAEQIWEQFFAYIYGTATYEQLLNLNEALANVWAAALHIVLNELMTGAVNEAEIKQLYSITNDLKLQLKQSYQVLRNFTNAFPLALK
jgi:hypothetical protein